MVRLAGVAGSLLSDDAVSTVGILATNASLAVGISPLPRLIWGEGSGLWVSWAPQGAAKGNVSLLLFQPMRHSSYARLKDS